MNKDKDKDSEFKKLDAELKKLEVKLMDYYVLAEITAYYPPVIVNMLRTEGTLAINLRDQKNGESHLYLVKKVD